MTGDKPPRSHLRELASEPCPRCGGIYEKGATECGSCGLIFAKMKKPGEKIGISAPPALEGAWQEVLNSFHQEEAHNAFIEKCITSNNVLFASQKYRQLLDANPSDEISMKMRDRIVQRVSAIYLARVPGEEPQGAYGFGVKLLFVIFGLGLTIALLGFMIPVEKGGTIFVLSGAIAAVASAALFVATRNM